MMLAQLNPMARNSKPKPKRRFPVEVLTQDEFERLVHARSTRGYAGIRDRAALWVMYRCCLRISEALSLAVSDVDLINGTIRVRHGKGDKARTVGAPGVVVEAIKAWLVIRVTLGVKKGDYLFCSIREGSLGNRVCNSHFRHKIPVWAKAAGIEKRVHPHGLRHSGAIRLLRTGVNVGVISQSLGHSDLAVTNIYLNHIENPEVIEAMKRD